MKAWTTGLMFALLMCWMTLLGVSVHGQRTTTEALEQQGEHIAVSWPWSHHHHHHDNTVDDFMGATVHVANVQDTLDDSLVGQVLVSAYTATHPTSNYHVQSALVERSVVVPSQDHHGDDEKTDMMQQDDDEHVTKYYWLLLHYTCDNCDPNADLLPPLVAGNSVHADFEAAFCQELRDSGLDAYADVQECKISFTFGASAAGGRTRGQVDAAASLPMSAFGTELVVSELVNKNKRGEGENDQDHGGSSRNSQHMGIEFHLEHVDNENAPAAANYQSKVLNAAFKTAFETVHGKTDQDLSFVLERAIDVPEDDKTDDEHALRGTSVAPLQGNKNKCTRCRYYYREWITRMTFDCRLCGGDDDDDNMSMTASSASKESQLWTALAVGRGNGRKHQAMEAIFCDEMRNSGLPEYASIKSCSINFSYKNMQDVPSLEKEQ